MATILAAAQVQHGAIVAKSDATVSFQNGKLSFSNPNHAKFVALVTDAQLAQYITTIHWLHEIGPDYIGVSQKALDTGNRTYPATDFSALVIAI